MVLASCQILSKIVRCLRKLKLWGLHHCREGQPGQDIEGSVDLQGDDDGSGVPARHLPYSLCEKEDSLKHLCKLCHS